MPGPNKTVLFLQHDVGVQIPDDTWSPIPWQVIRTYEGGQFDHVFQGFNFPAATSVAVGSNGAVLPVATINVVSTAGFAQAGYLLIRVGATDRVVQYTGKNATQFTGCTFGVGTLTTGDAVRQGLVNLAAPQGTLLSLTSEIAWTSNATGVRGIRLRDQSALQLEGGGDVRAAVATPAAAPLRTWFNEQPGTATAFPTGQPFRIEAYQNSTTVGGLATLQAPLAFGYPRLVAAFLLDF